MAIRDSKIFISTFIYSLSQMTTSYTSSFYCFTGKKTGKISFLTYFNVWLVKSLVFKSSFINFDPYKLFQVQKIFFSEARTLLIYFKPFSPPLQIPSYWPGKMQLRECVWTLGSCVLLKLISSKTQQNTSKIGNDQDRIKFDISLHPLSLPFGTN